MSRTLLAIISSEADNERLARHWPYFKMTGFDILGCGTIDGKCEWPENAPRLNTGKVGTRNTPAGSVIFGLCEQELDILRFFLADASHDSLCIVEADNLFVRRPPDHPGDGLYLVTVLANYSRPGLFSTPIYFSTPRWSDRKCAEQLYLKGSAMFDRGDTQHYVSDRFMAHVCLRNQIPWIAQPAWSPAPFAWGAGNQDAAWRRDSTAAIKIGCYCLHSVKHQWQLDWVKPAICLE